jgi:hypothetical protein
MDILLFNLFKSLQFDIIDLIKSIYRNRNRNFLLLFPVLTLIAKEKELKKQEKN